MIRVFFCLILKRLLESQTGVFERGGRFDQWRSLLGLLKIVLLDRGV